MTDFSHYFKWLFGTPKKSSTDLKQPEQPRESIETRIKEPDQFQSQEASKESQEPNDNNNHLKKEQDNILVKEVQSIREEIESIKEEIISFQNRRN